MKFDLKQLQAFVTLADTANYREAANRLFELADRRLYDAKQAGRDRIHS